MQHSIRTLHKIFILNDLQFYVTGNANLVKTDTFLNTTRHFITIHFYVQHF